MHTHTSKHTHTHTPRMRNLFKRVHLSTRCVNVHFHKQTLNRANMEIERETTRTAWAQNSLFVSMCDRSPSMRVYVTGSHLPALAHTHTHTCHEPITKQATDRERANSVDHIHIGAECTRSHYTPKQLQQEHSLQWNRRTTLTGVEFLFLLEPHTYSHQLKLDLVDAVSTYDDNHGPISFIVSSSVFLCACLLVILCGDRVRVPNRTKII